MKDSKARNLKSKFRFPFFTLMKASSLCMNSAASPSREVVGRQFFLLSGFVHRLTWCPLFTTTSHLIEICISCILMMYKSRKAQDAIQVCALFTNSLLTYQAAKQTYWSNSMLVHLKTNATCVVGRSWSSSDAFLLWCEPRLSPKVHPSTFPSHLSQLSQLWWTGLLNITNQKLIILRRRFYLWREDGSSFQ